MPLLDTVRKDFSKGILQSETSNIGEIGGSREKQDFTSATNLVIELSLSGAVLLVVALSKRRIGAILRVLASRIAWSWKYLAFVGIKL